MGHTKYPTIAFTLTPKAGAFFPFANALLKVAFAKALVSLGAGSANVVVNIYQGGQNRQTCVKLS